MQRKSVQIAILVIVQLTIACTGATSQSPRDGAALGSDPSLNTTDYLAAGLPDPNQPWDDAKMAAAARALERIATEHPGQLPSTTMPRSRAFFSRFTSVENHEICRDATLSDQERRERCLDLCQAHRDIVRIYAKAGRSDALELFGSNLQCYAAQIRLLGEAGDLSPRDINFFDRLVKYRGLGRDLAPDIVTALAQLRRPDPMDPDTMARYLSSLSDALPTFAPAFGEKDRQGLLDLIQSMRTLEEPTLQALRPSLDNLYAAVERAVRAAPPENDRLRVHRFRSCETPESGGCVAMSPAGFRVWLPAPFVDYSVAGPLTAEIDRTVRSVYVLSATAPAGSFFALKREYVDGQLEPSLEETERGWEKKGFVVERRLVEIAGRAFKELRMKGPAGAIAKRWIQLGNISYELAVSYDAQTPPNEIEPYIERFFASLVLPDRGSREP